MVSVFGTPLYVFSILCSRSGKPSGVTTSSSLSYLFCTGFLTLLQAQVMYHWIIIIGLCCICHSLACLLVVQDHYK